jgi:DNA-binding GntR family transcriptional regulator
VEIREGNMAALSPTQKQEIREKAAAGVSRRKLMQEYGVSESTIRRAIR